MPLRHEQAAALSAGGRAASAAHADRAVYVHARRGAASALSKRTPRPRAQVLTLTLTLTLASVVLTLTLALTLTLTLTLTSVVPTLTGVVLTLPLTLPLTSVAAEPVELDSDPRVRLRPDARTFRPQARGYPYPYP